MKPDSLIKDYDINFAGLKMGKHSFEWKVGQWLFEYFGYDDGFSEAEIDSKLSLTKKDNLLELEFSHNGSVLTNCDVTGDEFRLPVLGSYNLIIKLGNDFVDMSDEMIEIPSTEFKINVANWIYESIVLSIPIRRVSEAATDAIDNQVFNIGQNTSEKENKIDPRWEKLKNLITNKNQE